MKKVMFAAMAMVVAVPAQAGLLSGANLINVAKTVLGNSSILNKAQTNCPARKRRGSTASNSVAPSTTTASMRPCRNSCQPVGKWKYSG